MSKITSMKTLRERMIQAFQDFEDGKIDTAHLAALAKANETIISGLKAEMQYAILTNQEPAIPFFGEGSGKLLQNNGIKKLL